MSSTPRHRIYRLGQERDLLNKHFQANKVCWIDPKGKPQVEVKMLSNNNNEYLLRIYLPEDYPNSSPKLVVVEPKEISHQNGSPIPENCREFHTFGRHDGFQAICYGHPTDWCNDFKLFQVFMKGRLWLEAYEGHLASGEPLDYYLRRYSQTSESSDHPSLHWSPQQIQRLEKEEETLYHYYPGRVEWNSCNNQRTIDLDIETDSGNFYKLRVYLPPDFPNSCPTLAIASPRNLRQTDGQPLPENSEAFRTLEKRDGLVTICHFSPHDWKGDISIGKIFTKGEIWVNAYDKYIFFDGAFSSFLNQIVQSSKHE